MYDYLAIEKYFHGKDTPSFNNLKWIGRDLETHTFKISNGFSTLKVYWNEITERLQIKGSIPYFMQGHNFEFPNTLLYESVEILEQSLQTNLLDAEVKGFEYAKILKVEQQPIQILHSEYSVRLAWITIPPAEEMIEIIFIVKTDNLCKRQSRIVCPYHPRIPSGTDIKIERQIKIMANIVFGI